MMETFIIGIIGIIVLLVLLASGVHIALALGAVGLFGSIALVGFNAAATLAIKVAYGLVTEKSFIVLPLFIFMGLMAGAAGMSRDLYNCFTAWFGHIRGGLGIATVASCTAFGVCTGSSLVTAAVFSRTSAPEMRRYGYDKRSAYGICAAAGSIGMLIPPSVLIVVYGIISQLSVGKLLIAGMAPGILLFLTFSLGIFIMSYIRPNAYGGNSMVQTATWRERFISIGRIWPVLILVAIIVVGLFGGLFNPTEAAAFGALVILILVLCTSGKNRWKILSKGIKDSISTNAMVFFILIGAGIFARFLALSGITNRALQAVIAANLSQLQFTLIVTFILLVLGVFLDSTSILCITLPILLPVVNSMKIDPIWFAMVSVLAVEVGLITPPVGLNVYAAKGVAEADVTLEDIFFGSLPMFIMMLISLAIIIAFPHLSTFLPNMMT